MSSPLPRQAVTILRQLHELTGSYSLLFPGQQNAERPMSENTINKALRLVGYGGRQTGHGFRHLLSTELNSRGYNRDWIERQLAHGDKDEIRGTYNHATYLEQRRGHDAGLGRLYRRAVLGRQRAESQAPGVNVPADRIQANEVLEIGGIFRRSGGARNLPDSGWRGVQNHCRP